MSTASQTVAKASDMGALYHEAFLVNPEAITVTDLTTGVYLDVNASFEQLIGIPREELIGRPASSVGIWADPNERARLVERIASDVL